MPEGLSYRHKRHVKREVALKNKSVLVKKQSNLLTNPLFYHAKQKEEEEQCYCLHLESFQPLATRWNYLHHLHK